MLATAELTSKVTEDRQQ